MTAWSETWTWIDGTWHEGNPAIAGPRTHALWQGSSVFDGARYFDGVMPDLDLHCARFNASAGALHLKPVMQAGEIMELTREGVQKFASDKQLYIKPMYWAEMDGPGVIAGDTESTRFALCIFDAPMAGDDVSISVTLSPYRRPSLETMPVNAKAGCLYPNGARAVRECKARGFDNAVMLDMLGHVAELTAANIFIVKDGEVHTPVPNGTFLNGITRQRVIQLLRKAGYAVHERTLRYEDLLGADELFSTGNYNKVVPVNRIEDRVLEPGPVARKARELYFEFARA
ncbi:branched-chain amino acid aminotransferase [Roseibium aestuarii]|uniref:Probable branched-chain-amino-acid aminotransferase n=1 Tax=Roseibium aestuarii TaxID=2600299 RepID=A0ABW4JTN6_9HYPH|nr:branched-chain amino acid aminotransferase [Roseibium aestuarii]